MAKKIRKKRGEAQRGEAHKRRRRRRKSGGEDYVEVGRGEHCVMTINRHDGSVVVQRFETREEAEAQHNRNIAHDKPLVGVSAPN